MFAWSELHARLSGYHQTKPVLRVTCDTRRVARTPFWIDLILYRVVPIRQSGRTRHDTGLFEHLAPGRGLERLIQTIPTTRHRLPKPGSIGAF